MRNAAKAVLALLVAIGSVPLSFGGAHRATTPDPKTDIHAYTAHALRKHFPNVLLRNQDGKPLRFYDDVIKGKIVIIQFMFTRCEEYCPMVTPNLVKVQKELQNRGTREVNMISITVDPATDTPAVLKEYANKFHVRPGWQFLTGKKADIDLIRRQLGVYDPDAQKNEHLNMLIMGREQTGRWIAMESLAKPEDIAYTATRLTDHAIYYKAGAGR